MKKLLFLLLAAATVTACDNDDENFNPDSGSYTCTLKVTDTAGDVTNQTSGVICNLTEQPDKSVALTMKNVKFTDNPREPVKTDDFRKHRRNHPRNRRCPLRRLRNFEFRMRSDRQRRKIPLGLHLHQPHLSPEPHS